MHMHTHALTCTHILSNGANGLISYGDMIIIHTSTHMHTLFKLMDVYDSHHAQSPINMPD